MPRNSNGTYTLPAGNPVVSGEVISTSWANPTMSDIAAELTNSLDRSGRGGMLAPFRFADGTQGAPGITWALETTTGVYRHAAFDMRVVVGGQPRMRFNATGSQVWNPNTSTWGEILSQANLDNFADVTQGETISGLWNFTTRPTYNAVGLVTSAEVVAPARQVATQYSLTGGGDLSADRTLSLVNDVASPGNNKVYGTDGAGVRGWYTASSGDVPSARQIATQHSLTGGGDLSADRTLSLVNDSAAPGNNKFYRTDGSGVRGWLDLPANVALTDAATVNFVNLLQQNGLQVGWRKVIYAATSGGTLTAAASGSCAVATGNVTIDGSVFASGDVVSVYNDTAGNLSVIQGSGMTLRLAGSATTGTRTLAQRGLMTMYFLSTAEAVCVGGGLS